MKNQLLEQVKEQVAKMKGFRSWKDLSEACGEEYREKRLEEAHAFYEISERYAKEFAKAELNELWKKFNETEFHSCANHVLTKIEKLDQ